ncbi:MAG: NUDIX hydrolase [bacterium]|nr:NUDIX hydrolase [bacterium]
MRKERTRVGKYKTIFQGVLFRVEQASVRHPDGARAIYERVVRIGTVSILAIDRKGRLLLLREYIDAEHGYRYVLPAGKLDKRGEPPATAAKRELREETGMTAKKLRLFSHTTTGRTLILPHYSFLATDLYPAPLISTDHEDITVMPTSLQKAFKLALAGKIHYEVDSYLIMRLYLNRAKYLPKK